MVLSLATAALGGAALSFLGGERANRKTEASTARQMAFQERMSSTAYQRGMEDMRKAGLNPILAYSKGGASAPGGASYTAQNTLQGAQKTALDIAQIKQAEAQVTNLGSQTRLNQANTALQLEKANTERLTQGKIIQDTALSRATTSTELFRSEKMNQEVNQVIQQIAKTTAETVAIQSQLEGMLLQQKIDESEMGQLLSWMKRAKDIGIGVDSLIGLLKNKKPGGFPALPSPRNNFRPKGFEVLD